MGLDQYAFSAPERLTVEKNDDGQLQVKGVHGEEFQWRKHSKLQSFFENAIDKGKLTPLKDDVFNCNPVELNLPLLYDLYEDLVLRGLQESGGGFFYGHQFQDEAASDYRQQDMKFCKWAIDTIKEGDYVYYDCWW